MNPMTDPALRVRVANFSDIDLIEDHWLTFDIEDTQTLVRKIRQYADLPYVYIAGSGRVEQITKLMAALKAMRSPCYPYAVFCADGADLDIADTDVDIVKIGSTEAADIRRRVAEYAAARFDFDAAKLQVTDRSPLPSKVDVAVVGAGVTGLYAASRLTQAGLTCCVLEKTDRIGGIWSQFANRTSRVNSSEGAYRLLEKTARSNRDHSDTREILEDIVQLAAGVSDSLFTETEVEQIETAEDRYPVRVKRAGEPFIIQSKGIILAINDRVGVPRPAQWENQAAFQGQIVSGISDDSRGVDWRDKKVVIVGMGAFAVENARTALEGGARHVTVVCRRHGTVCPKIIDYLNFATPYDEDFQHDKKSNLTNMIYWKKLYELSGATQPECWMGKVKHDGHTISVSDIWFIGHYLKKLNTLVGEIRRMSANGFWLDGQRHIEADIVVNCIGFERNTSLASELSGFSQMYNNNYLAKDFMYLADAYIDNNAFNSLFGSSVLEMVKFYIEVFIRFFDNPEFDAMIHTEGIQKISVTDRKWSHYIAAAMALIRRYPAIRAIAAKQVSRRTKNFLEVHDLKTYIAANKREWIATHARLAGRPMRAEDCLPFVFEKLIHSPQA